MILSQYVAKNQAHWEIPNGSKSLISSFFTLCSKTLAFEQCWPGHFYSYFLKERRDEAKNFLSQIFADLQLEGG